VLLILAQRFAQGLLGVLTVIVLVSYSTLSEQGWYYSALSVVALSTLFDLGQSVVIIQQSAKLSFSDKLLRPDQFEMFQLVSSWRPFYIKATACYSLFALLSGWWLLSFQVYERVFMHWLMAWIFLNVLTALNFLMTPILAVIEGSGGLEELYAIRLVQSVVGSVGTWLTIVYFGPIWAIVAMPLFAFMIGTCWLLLRFRPLALALFKSTVSATTRTTGQLSRHVAITWIAGYLIAQMATPILFRLSSPAEAGRMGLSLTIANMIAVLSQSSIASKIPMMVGAVERKQWTFFDALFYTSLRQSCLIFLILSCGILFIRFLIEFTAINSRIIEPIYFILLIIGVFSTFIINSFASKLRSFHKEPLVFIIACAAFILISLYVAMATAYGAHGVILIFFSVQCFFTLPVSWYVFKKQDKVLRVSC
jgi:hypothetical protein